MENVTANKNQVIILKAWERNQYDKEYPILIEAQVVDRTITRDDGMVVMNPLLEEYGCIPMYEIISPNWERGIMISSNVHWDGMGGDYRNQATIYPNEHGIYCADAFTAYAICRAAWKK